MIGGGKLRHRSSVASSLTRHFESQSSVERDDDDDSGGSRGSSRPSSFDHGGRLASPDLTASPTAAASVNANGSVPRGGGGADNAAFDAGTETTAVETRRGGSDGGAAVVETVTAEVHEQAGAATGDVAAKKRRPMIDRSID